MAESGRFERVAAIFEAALDQPPEARGTFVAEACGDDSDMRAEVESLLEHDTRARRDFLALRLVTPRSCEQSDPTWALALVGERIGRYTVVRLLGHGGMGCVFEAMQQRPARTVALKVVEPGISLPSALARFRLEPEFLGRLQHPNIAQVYEAGVHEDERGAVPYFAMEFVDGAQSLLEYANARRLTIRERLAMFAKVCDAVHHGHQKGVIHRDLKPANILVGAGGEPKVIDFGVARASGADIVLTTQCTHVGDLVGTVHYMSPEQCDGDPSVIDTRSDIYSLGVVLYELLTGTAPYETSGTTVYGAIRLIREQQPRQPSAVIGQDGRVARQLRGDVDAILLRALEKSPARRYASAADLAQDIRRHLAGEPVEARRASAWQRILRWAGRRPRLAASAAAATFFGLVAITTLGASWAYLWYYFRQPYKIEYGSERRTASLVSRGGTPIHTWRADFPNGLFSECVQLDPGDDDLRYVAVGYRVGNPRDRARQLQVFDLSMSVRVPRWTWQIRDQDLPDAVVARGMRAEQFFPANVWAYNIFPEGHGSDVNELVCQFSHNLNSWRALCIFSAEGELLYSIWNDGGLFACHWLPTPHLLLVAGENQTQSPHDRGYQDAGPCSQLLAVFALRPGRGMLIPRTVHDQAPSESGELAWYKWLSVAPLPKTSWTFNLATPHDGDASSIAELGLDVGTIPPCAITWWIDAYGRRVSAHVASTYRAARANPHNEDLALPPVEAYELQDAPPGQ